MEIAILIVLVFIIGFQFYLLKCVKKETPKEVKLTDEQKKRQEELRKSFENLMGYGYDDALKKKE